MKGNKDQNKSYQTIKDTVIKLVCGQSSHREKYC